MDLPEDSFEISHLNPKEEIRRGFFNGQLATSSKNSVTKPSKYLVDDVELKVTVEVVEKNSISICFVKGEKFTMAEA